MYKIEFTDTARKQFLKLPKNIQERVSLALERIRVRPEMFVKRLVDRDAYRLRVGDYRVIIEIRRNVLVILVIKIGHRKNVYD